MTPGLTVFVPSRNRPYTVHDLWKAFQETTTNPHTELVFIVDKDDPTYPAYAAAISSYADQTNLYLEPSTTTGMVNALNERAMEEVPLSMVLAYHLAFMGDD